MLRVDGLSHSCPTYSLNSRLLAVPLILCTRVYATVTMHQPSNHPAATITIPAVLLAVQHPNPDLLRFCFWSDTLNFLVYFYPNKSRPKLSYQNTSIALSSLATPCPILILPVPPTPPVLTSSWPPGMGELPSVPQPHLNHQAWD